MRVIVYLQGPIYFMWGTDWEDQPMINAKRLVQRLPKELVFDWKAVQKPNNRLQSMFKAVSKVQSSTNPAQPCQHAADATCHPLAPGLSENREGRKVPLGKKSFTTDDEQRANCPSADHPFDERQSSPVISPPSLEPSSSPNTVNEEASQNTELEGKQTPHDVSSKKRAALSSPALQGDGADGRLYGKSIPRKAAAFLSGNDVSKKVGPAKKLRAGNVVTPSIKSFFKPLAPKDA